jgi:hypothetical protein
MSVAIPTYHLRARIAGLSRDRAAKDPELLDARAQLAVQQRQRITALFEAGAK